MHEPRGGDEVGDQAGGAAEGEEAGVGSRQGEDGLRGLGADGAWGRARGGVVVVLLDVDERSEEGEKAEVEVYAVVGKGVVS